MPLRYCVQALLRKLLLIFVSSIPSPLPCRSKRKKSEFRKAPKTLPPIYERSYEPENEGNGRPSKEGRSGLGSLELRREADRNPFPGREGSTGAVSTMPQSGLTSRDRRVRPGPGRFETIVPLISPVPFVCVSYHYTTTLLSFPRSATEHLGCTRLKLGHCGGVREEEGDKGGEEREGRGKQDREERASRSRLNVASPGL